jgi:hypothetical protein
LDVTGAVIDPAVDPFEGSSADWQSIQNWFAAAGEDLAVTVASPDVPVVQVGGFNTGRYGWKTEYESPFVLSLVMNNYWYWNFKASQGGEFKWRYSVMSAGESDLSRAARFGRERALPLLATVVFPSGERSLPPVASFCRVQPESVLATSFRPARSGGGVIVHLRELEGKEAKARLKFPLLQNIRAYETSVLQEDTHWLRAEGNIVDVPVGALGYKSVRIVPERE